MVRTILKAGLCLAVAVSFVGCGGPAGPKTVPATVTVTFKGKPVEGATVGLAPKTTEGGNAAFGVTNAQGVADMRASRVQTGVVPGDYIVTVSKSGSDIPTKYDTSETSTLEAKVSDGGDNNIKVDLKE